MSVPPSAAGPQDETGLARPLPPTCLGKPLEAYHSHEGAPFRTTLWCGPCRLLPAAPVLPRSRRWQYGYGEGSKPSGSRRSRAAPPIPRRPSRVRRTDNTDCHHASAAHMPVRQHGLHMKAKAQRRCRSPRTGDAVRRRPGTAPGPDPAHASPFCRIGLSPSRSGFAQLTRFRTRPHYKQKI